MTYKNTKSESVSIELKNEMIRLEIKNKQMSGLISAQHRSHVYTQIEGWFDYEGLYSHMVESALVNSHFVEVGTFIGKSAAYMAIEIHNSRKKIRFDAVDVYDWNINRSEIKSPYEDLFLVGDIFDRNMERFGLGSLINKVRGYSSMAAGWYEDASLDFVFLDADHTYEAVRNDIVFWLPKIKQGGYLGGHDYNVYESPGVIRAVEEMLENRKVTVWGEGNKSWLYQK